VLGQLLSGRGTAGPLISVRNIIVPVGRESWLYCLGEAGVG
jgi:hypothetical protein